MAAGLLIMGVCTWSYTLVSGFWPLVLLIVCVKTASVVFGLTNVAVIPETFGKSRSVKAAALIGVLGVLVSLVIKGTVIATWKAHDPATWNLAFRDGGRVHGGRWRSSSSCSCASPRRHVRWPIANATHGPVRGARSSPRSCRCPTPGS